MKQLFLSGIQFIRENPRMLYALILLVFVPAAFFLNTYSIISGMEKDIDRITHRKAVLAENIINVLVEEKMDDPSSLQRALSDITERDNGIFSVAILVPEDNASRFRILASNESEAIGQSTENIQYMLAWNTVDGIAFLDGNDRGRFWRVTKQLVDSESGEKRGLVSLVLPLSD